MSRNGKPSCIIKHSTAHFFPKPRDTHGINNNNELITITRVGNVILVKALAGLALCIVPLRSAAENHQFSLVCSTYEGGGVGWRRAERGSTQLAMSMSRITGMERRMRQSHLDIVSAAARRGSGASPNRCTSEIKRLKIGYF